MYRKEANAELRFIQASGRRGWLLDCSDWRPEERAVLKRDIDEIKGKLQASR